MPWPRTTADAAAPAKVNLTLHVTGRRADGYHLLDSLVIFAGVGDHVTVEAARETTLRITGPRAGGVPTGADNLVLRAAALFAPPVTAAITLVKNLPAASGIGGGSSDAAATLRALAALSDRALPDPAAVLRLGADMPVCLAGTASRLRGIGEDVTPVAGLPAFWLVLVNPGVEVATPAVFGALDSAHNPPMPEPLPRWNDVRDLALWLATQRNDLEVPARAIAPAIDAVLAALSQARDCALARMSGSGATCFGLFAERGAAEAAAAQIAAARPDWWVAAAPRLA